ncbi:MAG: MBL fold metallo-hydrolase [Verrucomicrobiota bacterium]|nr:MBL fold metallo-hydrolase [Verrucomicrobiota bacterium]
MQFFLFPSGPLRTNAILVEEGGVAAVIDPAMGSAEKILQCAARLSCRIEVILLTHSHWDHIVDVHLLKEKTGASLYVHRLDAGNMERPGSDQLSLSLSIQGASPDHLLNGGETISVGSLSFHVLHTPGHSPGSVSFYLPTHHLLFSGDTLFCRAIGRTDLPTGAPEAMKTSLQLLATLPPDTRVIPGHGPETTIVKELLCH